MSLTLIGLCLMINISCVNRTVERVSEDTFNRRQFFKVDYEGILNQEKVIRLSEIASDIVYVPLETKSENLIKSVVEYRFTDDFIFVKNVNHVLMFDRKGNFIRQIGKPGRGPGEIGVIRNLSILEEEKQIVVQTNWSRKLYFFNFEGEFLYSNESPDVKDVKILPDGKQLLFDSPNWGTEKYVFILRESSGDTITAVNNHYFWENKIGFASRVSYQLAIPFYDYDGSTSMKFIYNDTVYNISGDSIVPEYMINMGRYKLKDEDRIEVLQVDFRRFLENSKGYRFASPFEAKEKLFIASLDFSDNKEENQWNMIYDRRSSSGNLVVDVQGEPGKIINDIDGGPDFWPLGTINDSTVYMVVMPYEIIGDDNKKNLIENEAIDIEKKKTFLQLATTIRENDNPILMVVNLK